MTVASELNDLKERIELRKTKKIKLEGQVEQCYKYLKETFLCNTIEEGKKKLKKFDTGIKKIDTAIEKEMLELEKLLENES